ncbi:MAG: Ig-like domain-containing protein [Lachnospiraceae bacterium]|nr:Ig-like domain-containing protein [Lachnospiraceae bacterium]
MNKLKKAVVMVLAFAMVLTCAMVTPVQAAGKLNKKSVSIYETETVSLTVKGVKSVTWKTSDKKIATVDKKGLVKGVKKGTCIVTATDTKTKAAYSCKVTVKAAKSLGIAAKDISVFTGGETISYPGEEIKGATYVLDGKKLGKKDYSTWTDKDGERVVSYVTLTKKLTDGKHTFAIQKKGYKTVTKSFKFTALKVDGMFPDGEEPWVSDGTLYVICTPKLDGKDFVIKVDGTEVKPKDAFLNGDGVFVIWVDATGLSEGEHKVSVTAEGIPDGEASFTVK